MALGRRKTEEQGELFIMASELADGSGHPFYQKLNEVLREIEFDRIFEELCEPYYRDGGRPGIAPGVFFRMLLIGYFEGLNSQRGIAWRCQDSLALRKFLGVSITERTPAHNSMTVIRKRLPETVFEGAFALILKALDDRGLLKGKTIGIDATTLEANAAMRSIIRIPSGQKWTDYLKELAQAEGIEEPTQEDLARMDRKRPNKKVSNKEWRNPYDPDARIAKMKDGRTHLAYKAEHAVDLESEAIVAANVTYADRGDTETGLETLDEAQSAVVETNPESGIEEVVADKGYHKNENLMEYENLGIRSYIPEQKRGRRQWKNKPPGWERAYRNNQRRTRGNRGRALCRLRSEKTERTFAHICETGGGRRVWIKNLIGNRKYHMAKCAAYNLGVLLRKVFGLPKPRNTSGLPVNAPHFAQIFYKKAKLIGNRVAFKLTTIKSDATGLLVRGVGGKIFARSCTPVQA